MSCEGHLYSWPNSGHGQGFNCQLCHHTGRVSSAPCLKIVVLWVGGFWFCLQGNFSMWWLASSGPIWKRGHWDGQNVGQGTVEQLRAKSKSKQFFSLNFSLQPLAGAVDLCSRCQPIDRWRARFARLSHSELQEFQVSFFWDFDGFWTFVITAFIQLHRSGDQEFGRHPLAWFGRVQGLMLCQSRASSRRNCPETLHRAVFWTMTIWSTLWTRRRQDPWEQIHNSTPHEPCFQSFSIWSWSDCLTHGKTEATSIQIGVSLETAAKTAEEWAHFQSPSICDSNPLEKRVDRINLSPTPKCFDGHGFCKQLQEIEKTRALYVSATWREQHNVCSGQVQIASFTSLPAQCFPPLNPLTLDFCVDVQESLLHLSGFSTFSLWNLVAWCFKKPIMYAPSELFLTDICETGGKGGKELKL